MMIRGVADEYEAKRTSEAEQKLSGKPELRHLQQNFVPQTKATDKAHFSSEKC